MAFAFVPVNTLRLPSRPRLSPISRCLTPQERRLFCGHWKNRRAIIHSVFQKPSELVSATISLSHAAPLGTVLRTATTATVSTSLLGVVSTIVGVCVLIGSLLYKLPQILRVIRRRSAAGISVLMYSLETVGTTFSALYFARRAFPFSTYGETVFILIQNIVLLALIVLFQRLPRAPAIFLGILYFATVVALFSPYVPMSVLVLVQLGSIPILNLARVPQIVLNYRHKGTGELSPITLGLQLLGNVARIFTTIAQVRDRLMLTGICVATCFNTALFVQWLYYSWRTNYLVSPPT